MIWEKYFLQNFLYDGKEENGTKAAELFMSGWRAVYSYDPGRRRGLLFEVDEEKAFWVSSESTCPVSSFI